MDELNVNFLETVLAALRTNAETYGDGDGISTFVLNDAVVVVANTEGQLSIETYAGVPTFLDVTTNVLPYREVEHPQTRIFRILNDFTQKHNLYSINQVRLESSLFFEWTEVTNEIISILNEDFDE